MARALTELKNAIVPAEAYQLLMDNVQSVDAKTFCQQRMRENKDGVLHNQFYKDIKIIGKEDGVTRDLMRLITKEYHIKQGQDFRTASRRGGNSGCLCQCSLLEVFTQYMDVLCRSKSKWQF